MQLEYNRKFPQEENEVTNFENNLAQLITIPLRNLISTVKSRNACAILVTQNEGCDTLKLCEKKSVI